MNKNKKYTKPVFVGVLGGSVLALASLPVSAVSLDTDNPDLRIRWDNTVKYNVGLRVEDRDDTLGDTWVSQATNHGWDQGDVVTNRVDVLSEFDLIYKMNHGFRVSAAGWHDFAFDKDVEGNPAYQDAGLGTAYPDNKFTDDVRRYYETGGEILDAFAFTRVELGTVPVSIRAGRHNVYWGESLFTFGDSIAYGQGPLDLRKATSTPGVEAQELFLPQTQLSATAQLTDKITVAANYLFEWDPHRLPEGGTYLGGADLSFLGGTNYLGFPVVGDLNSGPNAKPDDRGSWGINAAIHSETLGGTLGLYHRQFDDRYPTMVSTANYMYNAYAKDVKLYGISYNRLLGSVSVGAEMSRREGTALASNGQGLALGDTWHALVNMVAYIGQTPLFDSAPLSAELTYARLDSVSDSTKAFFNHKDSQYSGCSGGTDAGCATDDAWGMQISFVPVWYQVFPGIDVDLPMNFGIGLDGNSPTPLGAAEGGGTWSVGVGLDIYSQYAIDLTYNDYLGNVTTGPNAYAGLPGIGASQWVGSNGSGLLKDRGWLSLTLKASF